MRVLGALIVVLTAASAFGQVIYEPLRYQHKVGGRTYYYAGTDPRIHESAAWPFAYGTDWGRRNGMAFSSANVHTHREVRTERPRVFTDALGIRNAWIHGFTANDARNEAYASVPLYWRKRDMLNSAQPLDRGYVVPSRWHQYSDAGGSIEIKPWVPAKRPSIENPVLVIPKEVLKRKLWGQEDKLLTSAD